MCGPLVIGSAVFDRRSKPDLRSWFDRLSPTNRRSSSDRVSTPLRRSLSERLPTLNRFLSSCIAASPCARPKCQGRVNRSLNEVRPRRLPIDCDFDPLVLSPNHMAHRLENTSNHHWYKPLPRSRRKTVRTVNAINNRILAIQ